MISWLANFENRYCILAISSTHGISPTSRIRNNARKDKLVLSRRQFDVVRTCRITKDSLRLSSGKAVHS